MVRASEEFAEVCGIHAGDGWMSSHNYEVGFGTSLDEREYFEYVFQLYREVLDFGHHRVLERPKNNIIELRIPSKRIQAELQRVGFVRGPKLDSLSIPDFVQGSPDLLKAFIRGLFDTDGTAYWRKCVNTWYLNFVFSTSSVSFGEEVKQALEGLGYCPAVQVVTPKGGKMRRTRMVLFLRRKADVKRWLAEIGFSSSHRWRQCFSRPFDVEKYDPAETFLCVQRMGPPGIEPGI